ARARTSGATVPSGPSASRTSSSRVPLRRVRMHVRSETCSSPSASSRSSFWGVRIGGLRGLDCGAIVFEPMCPSSHDDLVALLLAQSKLSENSALVLGSVARLAASWLDPLFLDEFV